MQLQQLAELSGIKRQTLSSYLGSREKMPSALAAVKIARVLGVSVEYLVLGAPAQRNPPPDNAAELRALVYSAEELPQPKIRVLKLLADELKYL